MNKNQQFIELIEYYTQFNKTDPPDMEEYNGIISDDFQCVWIDEDDRWHREGDLPAYASNIVLRWFLHNVAHRENGPAVVHSSGVEFWMDNKRISNRDWFKRIMELD